MRCNMKELYDANDLPLSCDIRIRKIQEKVLNNESLTMIDKVIIGRDNPSKNLGKYKCKTDRAYRAISEKTFERYLEAGLVYGSDKEDEYYEYEENGKTYNNNKGVNWYLGGFDKKYGDIIIECPAYTEYFILPYDNGAKMSSDPKIRFIKSSGHNNPIPLELITNVFDTRLLQEDAKSSLGKELYEELTRKQELRELYLQKLKAEKSTETVLAR